jgi:DNA topoisomerase IB
MARLSRVSPGSAPGIRRVRAGSGFRYLCPDGRTVSDGDRERINDLVIPPAWQDVWICADPEGHIQAVGTDTAGRRQYLYHPLWRQRRDRGKFARALALAGVLSAARRRVTVALRRDELDRDRVLATAFRLLDTVAPRVGSARYFERHGSRGLTTLQRRDVSVDGPLVSLSFPGKSGQRASLQVEDHDLARVVTELAQGRATAHLLAYRDGRRRVALRPPEVNAFVREITGGSFTAKDFRTLHGTAVAAQTLARHGPAGTAKERRAAERAAVAATAEVLGNTIAVARASYIDPRVFARYAKGDVIDLSLEPISGLRLLLASRER